MSKFQAAMAAAFVLIITTLTTGNEAIDNGLDWLKRHQNRDGSWSTNNFMAHCKGTPCEGPGHAALYDAGNTGLALFAFLNAGYLPTDKTYGLTIRNAIIYLHNIQLNNNWPVYSPKQGHYMYNHMICTTAMAKYQAIAKEASLELQGITAAVEYIINAQNPKLGWRYQFRGNDNDTSVTGWAVQALIQAKLAGIKFEESAFEGAKNWFDKATDQTYFRCGYVEPGDPGARPEGAQDKYDKTECMTAVAIVCRLLMKTNKTNDSVITGGTNLLLGNLPYWTPRKCDFYYWYYGTKAIREVGGGAWQKWRTCVVSALIRNQKHDKDKCSFGSWDTIDPWCGSGGRAYSTAINTLTLLECFKTTYKNKPDSTIKNTDKKEQKEPLSDKKKQDLAELQNKVFKLTDPALLKIIRGCPEEIDFNVAIDEVISHRQALKLQIIKLLIERLNTNNISETGKKRIASALCKLTKIDLGTSYKMWKTYYDSKYEKE